MIYKKIDISQAFSYGVSEECAKAFVNSRTGKKANTQRVFDNALKVALECEQYGVSAEAAMDRLVESGWSGMKWILEEAKRDSITSDTRDTPLAEDLTDRSWADGTVNWNKSTRDISLRENLTDRTWADPVKNRLN